MWDSMGTSKCIHACKLVRRIPYVDEDSTWKASYCDFHSLDFDVELDVEQKKKIIGSLLSCLALAAWEPVLEDLDLMTS